MADSWVVIIKTLNVLWRDTHGHETVSLCQAGLNVCVCVCVCLFVCLIYSVPLHWLNAVNVKWQYFNMGNAGQCGFWLCAVNILLFWSVRVWKSPSTTAKILTQLKSAWCIWEMQLNDMQTRDALNCKWEKRWAHSQQIILIENFHLCTGVQRQNIESGFIFFSAE